MFERFTDRARRVVVLAQEESRLLNHNYIGTEHLLLGLIHEGSGVAAEALEAVGISLEDVRRRVEEVIGQGKEPATGHIPFTPRAKEVLQLALRESLQLGHNYIGTEHILLGLIREGEGVGAQVLVQLGANLDVVRSKVVEMLSRAPRPPEPTPVSGVEVRQISVGLSQIDPAQMPMCAHCGTSLAGRLSYRRLEATGEEGNPTRKVIVLYCTTCGRAVDVELLEEGE